MKMLRIALYAALLVTASTSFSQTKEGDLVANVPFGFTVAQHKLPAGRYNVTRLNEFTLRISNGPAHSVLVNTHKSQRPESDVSSKMVFHRYGDTYFLSEIWVGSTSIGRALAPSLEEREMAQSTAEREVAVVRMGR